MADHPQGEEEVLQEDFSFPSILGNSPCSIDSPPWLYSPSTQTALGEDVPSRVKEDSRQENDQEEEEKEVVRVSVLADDVPVRDGSREDKMDMLWEDFNEELWGNSTTGDKRSRDPREFLGGGKTGSSKGSGRGRGGAVSFPAKRPGAVAFMKALRKIFLLRGGIAAAGPGPGHGSIKLQLHHGKR